MSQPLFERHGELFVPTEAAGNPWGELTGGGPVFGLLARAVEQLVDDPEMCVARMTVDLLRPVPRSELAVSARTVRDGKRLQVIEASLSADGVELSRLTAQALRRSEMPEATPEAAAVPFPGPDGLPDKSLLPRGMELRTGVHDVIDVRWLSRQWEPGPGQLWMRLPVPLLADEPTTPLVHVAVLADCISAASPVREPFGPWINSDVTLYLHREMSGEWLGIEAKRDVEFTGVGVAHARLFDIHGPIGVANEAVLVNQLG